MDLVCLLHSTLTIAQRCPVSLPQAVASGSQCEGLRQQNLAHNQKTYQLVVKDPVPFALVNLTEEQLAKVAEKDAFMRPYAASYKMMVEGVTLIAAAYLNKTAGVPISRPNDYAKIRGFFRATTQAALGVR